MANILSLDLEHTRLAEVQTRQQVALTTLQQVSMIGGFLAHKVPSVLGPIDWTAKALASLVQPTSIDLQVLMDSLLDSGRKARRLIDQCRSLGKPLHQPSETIAFAPLVRTVIQQMDKSSSIQIHEGLLDLPAVKANPALLAEVLDGVLQNACDAMPEGGELFISGETTHDATRLHIRDTGHGIAPEHLPHLFKTPFFTTKDSGHRSGFSLWLSWLYLQSVGGDIQVTQTASAGTTFTLSFPAVPPTVLRSTSAASIQGQAQLLSADHAGVLQSGTARVLIVEDESNWQGRLSLPFIDQGWEVHRASRYDEAMRLLDQHTFAAFVVDVRLVDYDSENIDGLEIVAEIRRREIPGPVLILSVWEKSLQQAKARFGSWKNVMICDKMDDDLEAALVALTTRHVMQATEHR